MEHSEEKWAQEYEKTLTELFGPPEKRRRRERGYFANLRRRHSEPLIRNILRVLAQVEDFAPARRLREMDIRHDPLPELIRPYDYPWFRLSNIRWVGELLEVNAVHGMERAGGAQMFVLRHTAAGLRLHALGLRSVA
ncbi:hypothetical protein E5K00_18270 [Hymenobacter aquaticus]|uniref:Uncharacterized protein n=1 Tax=Hymenobacter aquaticus TaxID=1867101 RepID=A0A4Z0PZ71_9BACT|nr:hypothetical protein [Hymenobacter aquaticus]TGE22193.1 hypothetical protein E5K00_18270 [Hymenobacter aquaticus]